MSPWEINQLSTAVHPRVEAQVLPFLCVEASLGLGQTGSKSGPRTLTRLVAEQNKCRFSLVKWSELRKHAQLKQKPALAHAQPTRNHIYKQPLARALLLSAVERTRIPWRAAPLSQYTPPQTGHFFHSPMESSRTTQKLDDTIQEDADSRESSACRMPSTTVCKDPQFPGCGAGSIRSTRAVLPLGQAPVAPRRGALLPSFL